MVIKIYQDISDFSHYFVCEHKYYTLEVKYIKCNNLVIDTFNLVHIVIEVDEKENK